MLALIRIALVLRTRNKLKVATPDDAVADAPDTELAIAAPVQVESECALRVIRVLESSVMTFPETSFKRTAGWIARGVSALPVEAGCTWNSIDEICPEMTVIASEQTETPPLVALSRVTDVFARETPLKLAVPAESGIGFASTLRAPVTGAPEQVLEEWAERVTMDAESLLRRFW